MMYYKIFILSPTIDQVHNHGSKRNQKPKKGIIYYDFIEL